MVNYITTLNQTNNYKTNHEKKMLIPLFQWLNFFVLKVIYVNLLYSKKKRQQHLCPTVLVFFLSQEYFGSLIIHKYIE